MPFLRRFLKVLVVLLIAAGLAGWWGWGRFQEYLEPVNPASDDKVRVVVEPGSSTVHIAETLHDSGLIHDPLVFRAVSRWKGYDDRFQAGEYDLSPAMDLDEIMERLKDGRVVTYSFTVPEGLTVEEIAALLEQKGWVRRDVFLEKARAVSWKYLPEGVELKEPLEGYLFPDTYQVTREVTEDGIIARMLARFDDVFTDRLKERAEELGFTVHEVVTLASIIEAEAQVDEERPVISAVYHNRLRINMKLDADPTLRYVMDDKSRPLLDADKERDSPYNTYMRAGLPPGPINAPGEKSILAALYPDEEAMKEKFLYFVSKNDGTHHFSRTYREHLQAVRQYR